MSGLSFLATPLVSLGVNFTNTTGQGSIVVNGSTGVNGSIGVNVTNTTNTTTGHQGVIPPALGIPFAMTTGVLYAVGATIASYSTAREGRQDGTWSLSHSRAASFLSFSTMLLGGLIVTGAYASGVSVPLAQATVVASNLVINMVLQIQCGLAKYTKDMKLGTYIFGLSVVVLGEVSPAPAVDLDIYDCLSDWYAQLWLLLMLGALVASGVGCVLLSGLDRSSTTKILVWAIFVAACGSMTDNWAKINGVLRGWPLVVSLNSYFAVGFMVMYVSVLAMMATDVTIYVPTNLCLQMLMNMFTGFAVWQDGDRVPALIPYLTCFILCTAAVYLSSNSVDLSQMQLRWKEMKGGGISHHDAKTDFGKQMIKLIKTFDEMKTERRMSLAVTDRGRFGTRFGDDSLPLSSPWNSTSLSGKAEALKDEFEALLTIGMQDGYLDKEEVLDLTMRMWEGRDPTAVFSDCMIWFSQTAFMQDYRTRDPEFMDVLNATLRPADREKMTGQRKSVIAPALAANWFKKMPSVESMATSSVCSSQQSEIVELGRMSQSGVKSRASYTATRSETRKSVDSRLSRTSGIESVKEEPDQEEEDEDAAKRLWSGSLS